MNVEQLKDLENQIEVGEKHAKWDWDSKLI